MARGTDATSHTPDDRALLTQAKALLMSRYLLTEPEAHAYLNKTAMELRVKMTVIAERVIVELSQ